ncbi:MAG TPA: hypothetical protein PLF13_07370 [candidate division Zixibacteria bacterium]|nr:hypothetical protein [candidate division Zixibacteria bacterium]
MGTVLRPVKGKGYTEVMPEKSILVSNAKIDRDGVGWERKPIWLRQELLGKLKVVSHFEGKTIHQLIDEALGAYVQEKWDNTQARKKMVSAPPLKQEKSVKV